MPGSHYKELFQRINHSRKKRGVPLLTWPEFLSKEPKQIHREKIKIQDYVEPDKKKEIQRPSNTYDNQSFEDIYKKYGV